MPVAVRCAAPDLSSCLLEVAVVGRPHGILGALRVHLHNPDSTALGSKHLVLLDAEGTRHEGVELVGTSGGQPLIKIMGITNRSQAELLRGARLMLPRRAVDLASDEILYADLLGCDVEAAGRHLGIVSAMVDFGAHEALVVRNERGEERLVPYADAWILELNTDQRRLVVDERAWELESSGD